MSFTMIDHIMLMLCVVIPVKELMRIYRKEGIGQVFVDGACHLGMWRLMRRRLTLDFYMSNLHKWLFCLLTATFLHIKKSLCQIISIIMLCLRNTVMNLQLKLNGLG